MQVRTLTAASVFIIIALASAACSATTKSDSRTTATSSGGTQAVGSNAPVAGASVVTRK